MGEGERERWGEESYPLELRSLCFTRQNYSYSSTPIEAHSSSIIVTLHIDSISYVVLATSYYVIPLPFITS